MLALSTLRACTTLQSTLSSDYDKHDTDFHKYSINLIVDDLTIKANHLITRIVMWADGCGKPEKGKKNFKLVSRAHEHLEIPGVSMEHNLIATAHMVKVSD